MVLLQQKFCTRSRIRVGADVLNKNANDVDKNCVAIVIAIGAQSELSRSSVRATVRAQSELTFYDTFTEMQEKTFF